MTTTLPSLSSASGLQQYLHKIRQFPILSADEEFMLAKRYQEHQDTEAAHRLVTSHLRLVVKVAMRFRGYGLPLVEMISEGNIGLMQAVKKFDPDKGFRLSTYAMWWIKAAIQEYILKSWSMVKVGTGLAQKRLFFNLKRVKNQIEATDEGDLTPEQLAHIAHTLDVSEEDVTDMNRRMIASDRSLNAPVFEDGDDMIDQLASNDPLHDELIAEYQEMNQQKMLFEQGFETLNEREQDILYQRRLQEPAATLDELSQIYNISRERVRQSDTRAAEKIPQLAPPQRSAPILPAS